MAEISQIKLPNGDTFDLVDEKSGYITVETDPVFSASAAAGISAADISNWNAKISDDKTWNGVTLDTAVYRVYNAYIPYLAGTSETTANLIQISTSPSSGCIAAYNSSNYLTSATPSANDNSTKVATTAYVDSAITALPEPMIFKGSLGTGGTITSLPTASSLNEGFTYKVITDGTYDSQSAKIGDTFISDGNNWILIPSGDEPSGTVTSITAGVGLTTADGNPITSSGTIKIKLNSETSLGTIGRTSKLYAVGVDSNGQLGVKVPWANDQVYTIKSSSSYVDMFLTGSTSSNTSTGYLYKDPSARLKVSDSSGETGLFLGDDITEGEKLGAIYLYSQSGIYTRLTALATTMVKYISLPDKTGIIALTSDIPSISLNGSSTTSASFYAPTTAGTSGYMLVSNGSGAPTWAQAIPATSTYNGNTLTISNQNGLFSVESAGSSNLNVGFSVDENGVGIFRYKASLASTDAVLGYDFTQQKTIVTELRTPTNNTDAATKKYVDDAVAAGGDIFVATVGTTTYADVLAAYNAGKTIVAEEDSNSTYYYYYFERYESANNIFYFGTPGHVSNNGTTKSLYMYTLDSSNTWSDSHIYLNIPIISLNGISNVPAASFYAPTTAGTSGQVLTSSGSGAPTWSAITVPTKTSDLTNDSGFITGMTILSYGSSTWQNFIDAYDVNKVVYCRASSNSNPASGSQTRLAFKSYYKKPTTPTEVEFQYYRSVSTHTASQQGDQVYVYKLNKTNGWSVTVREASVKVVAGTGLGGTYSNGTMTLTGPTISLNGSSTTSASFYAPTSAGTSGQVLTSNGSSAPTWEDAQSGSSAQIINWTTDIITPTITETSTVPLNGYNLDDEIEFNVELENTSELYLENVELECLDTGDEWNIGTTFKPNDSSNWDSQIRVISNHIRQGYVPIRITGLGVDTNTSNTYNFSNRIKITSLATPVLSVASTYTTNGSVSAVGDQCTITYYIANQNGSNLDIEEIIYFIVKVDTISDTNTATWLDFGAFSSTIGPGESEETLDSYTYTVTADDLEMDSVAIWCVSLVTTYSEKYDPTTITSADIEDFIAYPGENPDNPAYKWATDTTNSFIKTSYAIATVIDNTSE